MNENDKFKNFIANLSHLSINISLLEDLQEILRYAKWMKDLMSKKKIMDSETIKVTHTCSAIMSNSIVDKKKNLDAFTITCIIGTHKLARHYVNLVLD